MKRILLVFCVLIGMDLHAQDRIIMESGDTLKVVVASRDKKNVSYVGYDDPEFKTSVLSTERIAKIIFDNGKVIDFKKSKFPGAYVGIVIGPNMPVSDFSQTYYNDDRSGFAKAGIGLGVEGRLPIYKFIGVGGCINVGNFGVDEESYFRQYNAEVQSQGYSINGRLSKYSYGTFSIGPDLGFKLGSRLRIYIPLEFSMISMKTKDKDFYEVKNSSSNQFVTAFDRSSAGTGIGYSTGVRLECIVARRIGIGIQAKAYDYVIDNEVKETNLDKDVAFDYTWTQKVTYFHLGFTVRYHFRKL